MKYTITIESTEHGIRGVALDEEKQVHTHVIGIDPFSVIRHLAEMIADREEEFMESIYLGWKKRRSDIKEWVRNHPGVEQPSGTNQ